MFHLDWVNDTKNLKLFYKLNMFPKHSSLFYDSLGSTEGLYFWTQILTTKYKKNEKNKVAK